MASRCTRESPCDRHGFAYWADEDGEHKGECLRPEACADYELAVAMSTLTALTRRVRRMDREMHEIKREKTVAWNEAWALWFRIGKGSMAEFEAEIAKRVG